jgi:thymidylate synthase
LKAYLDLVSRVLSEGLRKENRTQVDTLSVFSDYRIYDTSEGFPLVTTKVVSWKNVLVEMLWMLNGSTNVALLNKHGVRIWNNWADKEGELGPVYGYQWRCWSDQVEEALHLLKNDPFSRRIVISAWNAAQIPLMALAPCHVMWIFNVQGNILNLHLTQRSADVALGVPYNIAGYAFLLHLFARFSNLIPGRFAHTIVDAHVYTAKADGSMAEWDHVPGLKEQLLRSPLPLPSLRIDPSIRSFGDVERLIYEDSAVLLDLFKIENYCSHPAISFKVAV